jgi:purine nucleosidase
LELWVDTDCALGALRGDVDDGFAIAALLRSPAVELCGISSVFGNTGAATAARCARALLSVAGAQLPVVEGAARAGQLTDAAAAIAALPEGARLLALGPLTNVAAALRRDPSLAGRIEIAVVGGNLSSRGRWPPFWPFEFNLAKDPAAARLVFDRARVRLYPLDVCRSLEIGARDLLRLRSSALGAHLTRSSWRWLAYAPLRYRALRFPLWDLVPALDAAGLLAPTVETIPLRLEGRGRLQFDASASNILCVREFDAPAALESFLVLITGRDSAPPSP